MLELPEAFCMARQITDFLRGKRIGDVLPLVSPHKFAWFAGDPAVYPAMLAGRTIESAVSHGGMVEILLGETSLLLSDGVNIRFHEDQSTVPKKHQLLLEFEDGTLLCFSVQMYGGIICFTEDRYDSEYYRTAMEKPSPLSGEFSSGYFRHLTDFEKTAKLSAKAFLATEQRIPGLGNGVLQDILFRARIHPKRKMDTLEEGEREALFSAVKSVLREMTDRGGRDTEHDLFGSPGGYGTLLCRNTAGCPCPACGTPIEKSSYMGGSVYVCPGCQPV